MGRVFVVQENPRLNIMPATEFGEIVVILPPMGTFFSLGTQLAAIAEKLDSFTEDDFLLPTGDPAAIGAAFVYASNRLKSNQILNVLKWDKGDRKYYKTTLDIWRPLDG